MGKISWIQNGSRYTRMEGEISNVESIPFGIYDVGFNSLTGWYLSKTADKFFFNYKIYDLQNKFLDYICKTYYNTNGNLGVLLWGHRGSGKTISAKVLSNTLHLPVIIVKSMGDNNDALLEYLSSLNFDCVLFFDEFEKQFDESDPFILQLMDGVYNSQYRKVFLLTTNELNVNANLLSRPSRIRYVRQFSNLPKEVVIEYFEDNLKDKCCIPELLDYIDTLTISTIDIIKSIVEEVNIHGTEVFLNNKEFFNVQTANYDYHVIYKEFYGAKFQLTEKSLTQALKDFTNFIKRHEIIEDYHIRIASAKRNEDVQKLRNELKDFEDKMRDIYYDTVQTNIIWNKLKVGMLFGDERIAFIDTERNVILTQDTKYQYLYFIENPNVKPSLYSEKLGIIL